VTATSEIARRHLTRDDASWFAEMLDLTKPDRTGSHGFAWGVEYTADQGCEGRSVSCWRVSLAARRFRCNVSRLIK
jgi:hypothetical protein